MGRIIGIAVVALVLAFGAYKIFSASVDRGNPDAVGKAFLKAVKMEDTSRAKKYYLPDKADEWEAKAHASLGGMRSNASDIFKAAIPDDPTFSAAPATAIPKGSTDKWLKAGDAIISLRQVDGKWYVTSSNQPPM